MRILLTNDDGIASDGLWAAARGLARVGRVTIIGTTADWSGCGAAIQLAAGTSLVPYREVPGDLGADVEAFAIDAAPGAAILAGIMSGLFEPFDLVVSGVNLGINVGSDLSHSGTVGAAITGHGRGLNAFAISVDRGAPRGEPQRWDGASDVAERLARWFGRRQGPPLLLNVNVPNLPLAQMRGASLVSPTTWGNLDRSAMWVREDPAGGWILGVRIDRTRPYPTDPATDSGAVMAGRIALTAVRPVGGAGIEEAAELGDLLAWLEPSTIVPLTS